MVSRIVGKDATTTTGNNLLSLRLETGLDVRLGQVLKTKKALDVKPAVPEVDSWRLPLLSKYLKNRSDLKISCENTERIDELISSLCSS